MQVDGVLYYCRPRKIRHVHCREVARVSFLDVFGSCSSSHNALLFYETARLLDTKEKVVKWVLNFVRKIVAGRRKNAFSDTRDQDDP